MTQQSAESVKNSITWLDVTSAAMRPIDGASCVFFRVAFGLLTATWAWDYLASGRVTRLYVAPEFNFSYYGFDWVTPWPGNGMYFHFLVLVACGLCITVGFLYRFAAALLAVGFIYVFLLERTNYQNHYYLLSLFCLWMPWLPLNRMASVDARRKPQIASSTVPAWTLWVLLFHVSVPYFFGGIAKLTPDWLLGQPMGIMLAGKADFPVLGGWLAWPPMAGLLCWFGILFDLLVVPALLHRPTRLIAFLSAIAFHLGNSVLFSIHVFPWFMILASTLFFDPSWPRRWLSPNSEAGTARAGNAIAAKKAKAASSAASYSGTPSLWHKGLVVMACLYVLFHMLWPLRHNLYQGETSWTERGHQFAWRMMLRGKEMGIGYALRDPQTGIVMNANHKRFLDTEQAGKFARDPEMILHMAHFLADEFEREMGRRPEIYAFVLASLNGRKPQLMVDPNVNLAAEPRGVFWGREWVLPLAEPMRSPPWDLPVEQWRENVELPRIQFLEDMQRLAAEAGTPPAVSDDQAKAVEPSQTLPPNGP